MQKPKILIVDDEVFFRRLFTEILMEGDLYDIDAVSSGKEALESLTRKPVDVILTDMVMPEICGLELIRRTRSLNPTPDIILATGNATVESAIQALKGGACDYLLKPCNPEQLRHTIKNCLEQRRLIAENYLLQSQVRLYQKGQHLSSQLDIDSLFHEALAALLQETGYARGLAYLAGREAINQFESIGFNDNQSRALAEKLRELTASMQQTTTITATDYAEIVSIDDKLSTLWVFPMHTDNQEHGALVINISNEDIPLQEVTSHNLLFLAEQVALGFRNACQYQGARDLIYTDDLTGLYNHRYLQIALEQEIRRSERYGLEFSLAFIDLDLFKGINDEHGHLVGSSVLCQVSDLLRECVRDADMLFRFGGDEFTALLVETDTRGAKIVTERIRSAIEACSFSTGTGKTGRLTATIGYATYPVHATNKKSLIDLSDKAMYLGKRERNSTRSAKEVSP